MFGEQVYEGLDFRSFIVFFHLMERRYFLTLMIINLAVNESNDAFSGRILYLEHFYSWKHRNPPVIYRHFRVVWTHQRCNDWSHHRMRKWMNMGYERRNKKNYGCWRILKKKRQVTTIWLNKVLLEIRRPWFSIRFVLIRDFRSINMFFFSWIFSSIIHY